VRLRAAQGTGTGSWWSALALFVYAAGFSFAYAHLTAATGALILFGAVQVTMVGRGLARGERLRGVPLCGFALALLAFIGLLLPGLSAPPFGASALMLAAGVAWGVYSLRGQGQRDPLRATAGNFARAIVPAAALSLLTLSSASLDAPGIACAIASGALASGVGYALWYAVLPALTTAAAAAAQLSVPVIAGAAGVLLLDEPPTVRLTLCAVVILGGIALVLFGRASRV